jgi:hypothetical protein
MHRLELRVLLAREGIVIARVGSRLYMQVILDSLSSHVTTFSG